MLSAFALGLIPFSAQYVLLRGFYAYEDTRTPFYNTVWVAASNAALSGVCYLVLPARWAVTGMAFAYGFSYLVGLMVALPRLRRRIGDLDGARIKRTYGKLVGAAILPAAVGGLLALVIVKGLGGGFLADVAALIVGGGAQLGLFVAHRPADADRGAGPADRHGAGQARPLRPDLTSPAQPTGGIVGRSRVAGVGTIERTPPVRPGGTPRGGRTKVADRSKAPVETIAESSEPAAPEAEETVADAVPDAVPSTVADDASAADAEPEADTPEEAEPAEPAEPAEQAEQAEQAEPARSRGADPHHHRPAHPRPRGHAAAPRTGPAQRGPHRRPLPAGGVPHPGRGVHQLARRRREAAPRRGDPPARLGPRPRPAAVAAARQAALLGDPRFVQVLDAVEEGELVYIIREWLPDATDLGTLLAEGPLESYEAYQMARQVTDAIAAAHRKGLSHLGSPRPACCAATAASTGSPASPWTPPCTASRPRTGPSASSPTPGPSARCCSPH